MRCTRCVYNASIDICVLFRITYICSPRIQSQAKSSFHCWAAGKQKNASFSSEHFSALCAHLTSVAHISTCHISSSESLYSELTYTMMIKIITPTEWIVQYINTFPEKRKTSATIDFANDNTQATTTKTTTKCKNHKQIFMSPLHFMVVMLSLLLFHPFGISAHRKICCCGENSKTIP